MEYKYAGNLSSSFDKELYLPQRLEKVHEKEVEDLAYRIRNRYTPLDFALLGGHHEVIQFMLEHGALSIAAIQDIAAVKIQAVYKGYRVRKAFQDRKNLLMKHDQLRKDAAAK
ncbi:hypothetical protein Chor_008838 [Crotalus horridus]